MPLDWYWRQGGCFNPPCATTQEKSCGARSSMWGPSTSRASGLIWTSKSLRWIHICRMLSL
jgi:hypothetical protein